MAGNTFRDFPHQYIERSTGQVRTERLAADGVVAWLYSQARESYPYIFKLATQRFATKLLAYLNYDAPLLARNGSFNSMVTDLGIDQSELIQPLGRWPKLRDIFERQIRFWETRQMPASSELIVSPSDSRVLIGSFPVNGELLIKEKFFCLKELIGADKLGWQACFEEGNWAIFRLTPEKYHYNHVPVSGVVVDTYEIDGEYHSCNPSAVVRMVTPYSKNRRCVTVIDTGVTGGSGVGFVAMIEVVALMIGEIVQCYSEERYDAPSPIRVGQFLKRGAVKSLFRPGSSTVVLMFEKDRVLFDYDLIKNTERHDLQSRFSYFFGERLVETDVRVRSSIARAVSSSTRVSSNLSQSFKQRET